MYFSPLFVFSSIFIILIQFSNEEIETTEIHNFTTNSITWKKSVEYIYYIDISNYSVGDENVLQLLNEDREIIKNLIIYEIDESILKNNNNNNNKIEDIKDMIIINNITNHMLKKYRSTIKKYYYEIIFQKKENQNNFVIYVKPNLSIDKTNVLFYLSKPVGQYNFNREDIDDGNYFNETFDMDGFIETFYKFNFKNISLENANIIFYVDDKLVSCFYKDYISTDTIRGRIFIIEKKSTNESNHSVYLALLGEAKKTKIKIALDYHDIKYSYKTSKERNSFYVEKLNCKNDYYIYENNNFISESATYHLKITPFYGDYKLIYYDKINGPTISDIFEPNNEIIITEKVKRIKNKVNILKLSCKTPTLLHFQYLKEYAIKNITEGIEIISLMDFNLYMNNYIFADDDSKKYRFYFGIITESELYNITDVNVNMGLNEQSWLYLTNNKSKTKYNSEITYDIYYDKSFTKNIYSFQTLGSVYLKIFLISNQYYKNVVSGLTKITSETNAIAFKIRKDIFFDYFIMKLYSHDYTKNISCNYELKIVESKDIINGKVMVGINGIQIFQKKEIILKFSNPYDKFDSRIKDDDYVFLLVSFNTTNTNEEFYPLYVDIRYYYNNQIINIKKMKPYTLLSQKEYQIFGDSNNKENNKVLLNINKCNITKDYYIKTYYENYNNYIAEEKISGNRNIILHDNLFNNTKFLLYSNNSTTDMDLDNSNNTKNSLLQASYYKNDDIYMNYFSINESLFNSIKITKDYKISYKDNLMTITLIWNDYITNKNIIKNLQVNYSLYILPQDSPISTICQMSLIPPNISIIGTNKSSHKLPKGKYKIGIIASVINDEFPITTFYDFSNINVPQRINIFIIIIFGIIIILVIAIIICIFCKKKTKVDDLRDLRLSKGAGMLSMASLFDNEEEDKILIGKDNSDDDNIKNK